MGRLDGRDDALRTGQILKGADGFLIRDGDIFGPAGIMEPGVLRAHAGIIQAGGDGIHRGDLAVFILAEIALHAVEDTRAAGSHGGGGFRGIHPPAGGLAADKPDGGITDKVIEAADSVAAAAYTGDDRVRQA